MGKCCPAVGRQIGPAYWVCPPRDEGTDRPQLRRPNHDTAQEHHVQHPCWFLPSRLLPRLACMRCTQCAVHITVQPHVFLLHLPELRMTPCTFGPGAAAGAPKVAGPAPAGWAMILLRITPCREGLAGATTAAAPGAGWAAAWAADAAAARLAACSALLAACAAFLAACAACLFSHSSCTPTAARQQPPAGTPKQRVRAPSPRQLARAEQSSACRACQGHAGGAQAWHGMRQAAAATAVMAHDKSPQQQQGGVRASFRRAASLSRASWAAASRPDALSCGLAPITAPRFCAGAGADCSSGACRLDRS